jgi:hypothetical protein
LENIMAAPRDPNRSTPRALREEITRYGGRNPFGGPNWRVVVAEDVIEYSRGIMRSMPDVSADADVTDIEPEKVEEGEFWTPRYPGVHGWILERWFPPEAWGEQDDWRLAAGEDGLTPMMGEWPRHGEYYMVSDDALAELPGPGYWKEQINEELRRLAEIPGNPARLLSETLYQARVSEERRKERFIDEVHARHVLLTDPMLATVGSTAQRIRDAVAEENGLRGNLAAG